MDGQRTFFCITEGEKARKKAMKIAVGLSGVESLALKGKQRDQIEVKGDDIDTVKLATLLRKKVGHASIVSVAEDKKEEKEEEKKDEKKDEPKIQWPHGPPYAFYEIRDPCYDTNACSIL
ncbi:heavy metal-associated isoprenylated plant protein 47 [Quercus suber]|uniref:heavy metal-associated isoprenylated plant protein 47 n=1 Tax=Quercus suber TaxID=58331 RepID=UPI000CE26268|nr:heavy metal-associated isoprenylated plant protein 47-like [Quercus suber]POF21611.1 heavy metal-associated isoprenylated plant protein 46 [Quercus suber]